MTNDYDDDNDYDYDYASSTQFNASSLQFNTSSRQNGQGTLQDTSGRQNLNANFARAKAAKEFNREMRAVGEKFCRRVHRRGTKLSGKSQ